MNNFRKKILVPSILVLACLPILADWCDGNTFLLTNMPMSERVKTEARLLDADALLAGQILKPTSLAQPWKNWVVLWRPARSPHWKRIRHLTVKG